MPYTDSHRSEEPVELPSSCGFPFTVSQPSFACPHLPQTPVVSPVGQRGNLQQGPPQQPCPPHSEVTSRARLGLAMGTGHLWDQARVALWDQQTRFIGLGTAVAEMQPQSLRMALLTAASGRAAALPALRTQCARCTNIRAKPLMLEHMAEPVHATRVPHIFFWKVSRSQILLG